MYQKKKTDKNYNRFLIRNNMRRQLSYISKALNEKTTELQIYTQQKYLLNEYLSVADLHIIEKYY